MASGIGFRGTVGRCYGFFADLKNCQEEVTVLRSTSLDQNVVEEKVMDCMKSREDYFECLHGMKENSRMQAVMNEKQRQEEEAKHGGSGGH